MTRVHVVVARSIKNVVGIRNKRENEQKTRTVSNLRSFTEFDENLAEIFDSLPKHNKVGEATLAGLEDRVKKLSLFFGH